MSLSHPDVVFSTHCVTLSPGERGQARGQQVEHDQEPMGLPNDMAMFADGSNTTATMQLVALISSEAYQPTGKTMSEVSDDSALSSLTHDLEDLIRSELGAPADEEITLIASSEPAMDDATPADKPATTTTTTTASDCHISEPGPSATSEHHQQLQQSHGGHGAHGSHGHGGSLDYAATIETKNTELQQHESSLQSTSTGSTGTDCAGHNSWQGSNARDEGDHQADFTAEWANQHHTDNVDEDENAAQEYMHLRRKRFSILRKLFMYPIFLLSSLLKIAGCDNDVCHNSEMVKQSMNHKGASWLTAFQAKAASLTFSTSFSGIDTPSVALQMLLLGSAELLLDKHDKKKFEKKMKKLHKKFPRNLWACEKYGPSQQELLSAPHGPGCVFADMQSFWVDSLIDKTDSLHAARMIDSVLIPLIMKGQATKASGFCVRHNRVCQAHVADVHIAGTPCVAYSPRGSGLGLEDRTVLVYLAWCSQRRLLEEPWIVQENVEGFDTEHLRSMLGDKYEIVYCILNPSSFGWPVQRVRKYHVMRHRDKTTPFSCTFHLFSKLFVRDPFDEIRELHPRPAWDVFLVATVPELQSELVWSSCRSVSRSSSYLQRLQSKWMRMEPEGVFFQTLNATEQKSLHKYMDAFPGQVFQLNQNPAVTATHSTNHHMFTLIRNAGVLWQLGLVDSILCVCVVVWLVETFGYYFCFIA